MLYLFGLYLRHSADLPYFTSLILRGYTIALNCIASNCLTAPQVRAKRVTTGLSSQFAPKTGETPALGRKYASTKDQRQHEQYEEQEEQELGDSSRSTGNTAEAQ